MWHNNNPAEELHLPFVKFLDRDDIRFVHGEVKGIDVDRRSVEFTPVEVAFSLAHWLEEHEMGDARTITLFTPAEVIAEDAGEKILDELLPMVEDMGFGYQADTKGIARLYEDGIDSISVIPDSVADVIRHVAEAERGTPAG